MNVKSVIESAEEASKTLEVKVCETADSGNHLHIKGTPDGFRVLANILLAQAEGHGGCPTPSTPCSCELSMNEGLLPFLTEESIDLLTLHCHDHYFASADSDCGTD